MKTCRTGLTLLMVFCFYCSLSANEPEATRLIEGWGEFVDQQGDCKVAKHDGKIEIQVPGTLHDLWPVDGKVNAPMVLRSVEGDYVVQVKVTGKIQPERGTAIDKYTFQAGSLIIWQDEMNFVRVDRACSERDGSHDFYCYYHVFENGKRVVHLKGKMKNLDALLRVTCRDGKLRGGFSQDDGKKWTEWDGGSIDAAKKWKVGVAALNTTVKPFHAQFEALQVKKL